MKYVFIFQDHQCNYYYNFADQLVYTSNRKENKPTVMGVLGVILGFLIYLSIGIISIYLSYPYLFLLIMGIIFGVIVGIIANSTMKDIFKGKGKKLSKEELKEMVKKNKSFRFRYLCLTIAFFILFMLNTMFYQNKITINFLLFTSVIMFIFLFVLYRPIENLRFLRVVK